MNAGEDIAGLAAVQPAPRPGAILRVTLLLLLVLRVGGVWASYALSGTYLNLQDRWLLLLDLALGGLALLPWPGRWRLPAITPRGMAVVALAIVLGCWAGHRWLLAGYDLSRDEQMAVFDARIYGAGHLVWPLPVAWRHDAAMLNLLFMLPVDHPVAWVSGYLPGNSLLRAGVGLLADPALTGPVLAAASAVLLWRIARRLWPDDPGAVAVATGALALSSQVIFAGMTAYAMPGHLAFGLLWLWLFLKDRRWADGAALLVGCAATGLHQPLFHPLFVAPWLALLLWRRRWGRLALFVVAYAVIGAFWLHWPHVTQTLIAGPGSTVQPGTGYVERLRDVLASNSQNLPMMACNLLRFCTWQAVPVVPLLVAGVWAARRDPVGLALIAGFGLPIVFFALALPYQGHGFGYRYVHQVLGNVALLCGFGWRGLGAARARWAPVVARGFALSLLVAMPVQAWLTHGIYAPFAAASARITATRADYAIVGAGDGPYALDLVLNRPDLANRPLRLSAGEIDDSDALAARLCDAVHPGRVVVAMPDDSFFDAIGAYFHAGRLGQANARFPDQARAFRQAGCRVIRMGGAGDTMLAPQ